VWRIGIGGGKFDWVPQSLLQVSSRPSGTSGETSESWSRSFARPSARQGRCTEFCGRPRTDVSLCTMCQAFIDIGIATTHTTTRINPDILLLRARRAEVQCQLSGLPESDVASVTVEETDRWGCWISALGANFAADSHHV